MEFDLHTHSNHSFDSKMAVTRMIEAARQRGLHGMAVTDHDSVEGGLEAEAYSTDSFHIIPGIEVSSDIGHIIGLYVREPITVTDPIEVAKAIKAQDGIVILPHPFRRPTRIPVQFFELIDGIECFNARYANTVRKYKQVVPDDVEELARRFGLAKIGSSDSHNYAEIGNGTTIIPGTSEQDIKRAIRSRTTVVGARHTPTMSKLASKINRWLFPAAETPTTRIVEHDGCLTTEREGVKHVGAGQEDYPDVFDFNWETGHDHHKHNHVADTETSKPYDAEEDY